MIENPKALAGRQKAPLVHVVPSTSQAWLAEAHLDGAIKYGPMNWREIPIKLTDYIDAAQRHIDALKSGEDSAGDSKILHAAHVMATMSIIIDARAHGTLIDDRVLACPDVYQATVAEILECRQQRALAKAA